MPGKTREIKPDAGLLDLEIRLLLDGIFNHYGFDLRGYAPETLKRRIGRMIVREGLSTVSGLQERVLHDPNCLDRLIKEISIAVSSMFRDPLFFSTFRTEVVPVLRTYPFIRIWHAGCAAGQEAYSMAILLHEEGLYDRCRIYATDINEVALSEAERGVFPIEHVQEYTRNHMSARGRSSLSEYYTARYEHVIFRPWLRDNMVFSRHNLATDGPFNEFNVIVCRNVMIYFNRSLWDQVHRLFHSSLVMFGFLGLGKQESIRFSPYESCYEVLSQRDKIYKKVR